MKKIFLLVIFAITIPIISKGSKINGTYNLDINKSIKIIEAQVKKLPKDQKQFGEFLIEFMKKMKYTLTISKDGKVKAVIIVPDLKNAGKTETSTVNGTWKKKGSKIEIGVMKEGKLDKKLCSIKGKTLSCPDPKMPLVFIKK